MLNYFTKRDIQRPCRADIIESLIAASKVASRELDIQERILQLAEQMTTDQSCWRLKARIVYRQSVLARLRGDVNGSEHAITRFLSSLDARLNGQSHEDLAALYLSQAVNCVYRFNFKQAHEELARWAPKELPGQESLLWDQIMSVGRVMRGEGRFEEATTCYETCLATPGLCNSKRVLIKSALADLYCELDYRVPEQRIPYLLRAEAIVDPEIKRLRQSSGHHSKGFRRLLLSQVEINIRQGCYPVVDSVVRELLAAYDTLDRPDIVDRLGHVRALIAIARISPTSEAAVGRWNDVLKWNKLYNPLEEEVFTCGVVRLCLCNTWDMLGDVKRSMESFRAAIGVLEMKAPQFLIPGFGTYVLHDEWDQTRSTSWWASRYPVGN